MVFEKTARKREEAAANAAIQATKPEFQKIGRGLDYLRNRMDGIDSALQGMESAIEGRQYAVEGHIGRLYDEIDGLRSVSEKQGSSLASSMSKINQLNRQLLLRCSCGAILSPLQMVCHECGTILDTFPFDLQDFDASFDISSSCRVGVEALSKTIQAKTDLSEEYAYKRELADEIFTMEQILAIAQSYIDNSDGKTISPVYARVARKARTFLNNCKNHHIEVAVVGNVKAGKSSLINALLGEKMASVDATPETSVLVKYRTTPDKCYIKLQFYTALQWDRLWKTVEGNPPFKVAYDKSGAESIRDEYLNKKSMYIECSKEELSDLIMKWTSSQYPEHFFVREMEVGYQGDAFPHDVLLVDTPGLRDPVKYRSDITRKYIKDSDWVIACIANENLSSQEEFDFLGRIAGNAGHRMERILIVATKADMLSIEDCRKKQTLFLQQVTPWFGNEGLAVDHFVSTAAECNTLLRLYLSGKIDEAGTRKLKKSIIELGYELSDISTHKEDIIKFTGIDTLFARIDQLFLKNRRKVLIDELKLEYKNTLESIRSQVATESYEGSSDLYSLVTDTLKVEAELNSITDELAAFSQWQQEIAKALDVLSKISERKEKGEV